MNVLYSPDAIVSSWSFDTATNEIQKQPGDDPTMLIDINRALLNRESAKGEDEDRKRVAIEKRTVSLEKIISEYPQRRITKHQRSNAPPTKVAAKKLKMYTTPPTQDYTAQWSYMSVLTWVCLPLLGILIACVTIRSLCRRWSIPGPVQGLDIRAIDVRPLNACSLSARSDLPPAGKSSAATPHSSTSSADSTIVSQFILDSENTS